MTTDSLQNDDLVSIITASFKSEKFISQTIDSVISQSFKNWEMIIVDDASPDHANDVIESYATKDQRIRLIKLEKNSGPALARNVAIKAAKGRYIAFLDADDIWFPEKLEKQITLMKKNGYLLSYCNYDTMSESGDILNKVIIAPKKVTYNDMLMNNYIGCLTAIYDSKHYGKILMPDIFKRQDYGLWLKILKMTDFAYNTNEVLARYRLLSNSVSSNKIKLIKYQYLLYRKCENFSISKSIYYTILIIINKLKKL